MPVVPELSSVVWSAVLRLTVSVVTVPPTTTVAPAGHAFQSLLQCRLSPGYDHNDTCRPVIEFLTWHHWHSARRPALSDAITPRNVCRRAPHALTLSPPPSIVEKREEHVKWRTILGKRATRPA